MWTILIFYFYADNLKVSTIVSIIFFFFKWFKFCVKIGFEVENLCQIRFASTFNVERVAVYYLVICKDSNDCLAF